MRTSKHTMQSIFPLIVGAVLVSFVWTENSVQKIEKKPVTTRVMQELHPPAPAPPMIRVQLPPPPALAAPQPKPQLKPQVIKVQPLKAAKIQKPATVKRKPLAPLKAKKRRVQKPPLKPSPKTISVSTSSPSKAVVQEGRTLLRLLEYGKGPKISISWPSQYGARKRLTNRLKRCFGLTTAMMDGDGQLYNAQGRWQPDLDLYSGFVRKPDGYLSRQERQDIANIHARGRAVPVRLFYRNADALLLGGLARLLGAGYKTAKTITAAYQWQGRHLMITNIKANGQDIAGEISLSTSQPSSRCSA